jgi:cytochrome c oxidase cbb3-type subunit 1
MVSFGSFYHLIQRLWETKMYSEKLIFAHFWLATIGIVLYISALWVAGIGQGLMLRGFDEYGNLAYTFIESVSFLYEPYAVRAFGGLLFVTGIILMFYNTMMTIRKSKKEQAEIDAKVAAKLANA